jgi:hypothetical protein
MRKALIKTGEVYWLIFPVAEQLWLSSNRED